MTRSYKKSKLQLNEEQLLRIAAKITYYRKLHGMTQEDLAKMVGITVSYLSRLERGKNPTGGSLCVMIKIADVLGVKIQNIIY
ncbi:helix-turn-helix transcriptional regulator [Megamonas hypermegale]|uniref:helix-turn-helix domain-containing protein n=1 Tax=Megamonas hypermegale TaxID=158847 RepID=UPI0026E9B9AF|nr:helix-turn-helix transcriptional regulator [Megamonas hypermegale]